MNPPQPTEKIYLDPVNEMIDNITENILGEVEEGQTSLVEKFEKKLYQMFELDSTSNGKPIGNKEKKAWKK
jgi:hypothetical protein